MTQSQACQQLPILQIVQLFLILCSFVFTYDVIGRMNSHGTALGSFAYTYLGQTGQPAKRSVVNGAQTVSTTWAYGTNAQDRRLKTITNTGVTRRYTLVSNPYQITKITDTAAATHVWATQAHNYTYDLADRLLTASAVTPGNSAYAYNKLDNATTVTNPGAVVFPRFRKQPSASRMDDFGTAATQRR